MPYPNFKKNSRFVEATAPGRICLAGEDIDWTTGPSVLCAIDLKITVKVSERKADYHLKTSGPLNSEIVLSKEQIGKYSRQILDYTNASIKVIDDLGVDAAPVSVEIKSNLPAKSGLSSSAAVSVASVAALARFYGLSLDTATVCDLAYKVEAEELRTGAGQMDLYSSGMGGLIYLDNSTEPPSDMERFVLPDDIDIVIADTLVPRNTADVIREKRKRFERKEPSILKYIETTTDAIRQMRSFLKSEVPDFENIGSIVTRCHRLIRDYMGVSTDLIEKCVDLSLENGALGAKLTGTGMGGCMFALVKKENTPALVGSLSRLPVKIYVTRQAESGLVVSEN
ncbi:MAG TPA: galactokinase family protein [Candidatus Colwellbacteria bacterium]|nr:galactokinase family protein [Candidatus Colwellbacteria bacterium]